MTIELSTDAANLILRLIESPVTVAPSQMPGYLQLVNEIKGAFQQGDTNGGQVIRNDGNG